MKFAKMHGLGNDFILISEEKQLPSHARDLAVNLCNRNFGIGADGLVYILPSSEADFKMRILNADGSEAEQCGNALRCVAKYVYEQKLTSKREMTIETLNARLQRLKLTLKEGKVVEVTVDMNRPILEGRHIPTMVDASSVRLYPVKVAGGEFLCTAVSMGNPHCVVYVKDTKTFDVAKWGPYLEKHPFFPSHTNVEFCTVKERDHVEMRVWERGAGQTLSCGTGACAALVASVLNGFTDRTAKISLPGGDLMITWDSQDNHVYMSGPATFLFSGHYEL